EHVQELLVRRERSSQGLGRSGARDLKLAAEDQTVGLDFLYGSGFGRESKNRGSFRSGNYPRRLSIQGNVLRDGERFQIYYGNRFSFFVRYEGITAESCGTLAGARR